MAKEVLRIENLKQHFVSGKGLFKKDYTIKAVDGVSLSVSEGETLDSLVNLAVVKVP